MSDYKVFAVTYWNYDDEYATVAVSALHASGAVARLKGHREAQIISVSEIVGRKPQYDQDRIEGTCDLANPMQSPPHADSIQDRDIRLRNKSQIESQKRKKAAPQ